MTLTETKVDSAEPDNMHYRAGLEFDSAAKQRALDLMARLLELHQAKSTDQADTTWLEPVENYRNDELFAAERELLFKMIPLPLALSVELPGPNTYKAMEVVGVPLLLTRDSTGQVHAMLNICRHRGSELCEIGHGKSRAIVCKYHAWSYAMDGRLQAVHGAPTFGDVDLSARGLHKLPVEERHGIVFGCLTPGRAIDLDSWLGEMGPILEDLRLGELHQFSSRQMPGPNWKVVIEGYLEGYHFASLHKNTVYKTNFSNLSAYDSFGPHARVAFGLRPLADAVGTPRESWEPASCVGPIVWVFPGLAIAGGWRDRMAIALPLPGRTREESMTEQRIMLRKPPGDDHEVHEAEIARDWFYDVTYGEDYITNYGVQRGVTALPAGDSQIFGRNEIGVQQFHRTLNRLMAENADGVHRQPDVLS